MQRFNVEMFELYVSLYRNFPTYVNINSHNLIQNSNDIKGILLIGYKRASSHVSHLCVLRLIRMRDMTHLRYSRGPAVAQDAFQ